MRPSKIRPGTKLLVQLGLGKEVAYFVKRIPARGGRKAENILRFPGFAGLNGPDDEGLCPMSDYDVSRRVEAA